MEISQLEQIYQILSDNGFDEIELRLGASDRIKMARSALPKTKPQQINNSKILESSEALVQNSVSDKDSNKTEIRSELVGVFQFMDEDENYFPKIGDEVAMGEKLGKILSLNSTKEIKSPIDGRIAEIAVKKNDIIDYGHLLFVIEDSSEIKA
ncbi:MAG: acetyl-CoA carboxylase biotin carboxyl carrier protein subunit [Candidatus Riflebacteria bacterium]|nr:acetyl-CoA carboxylase biotin carboxyl carrier protein subunit [Candidatus Riflebacteria bacterium]MBR4570537.1 acetyl-CoA carboxylase biotin carboxyl carrier protein subunit [Candidatus Riflebacteria bacterium]